MIIGGAVIGSMAGAETSPGAGRVFSIIGGSLIGIFTGSYIGSAVAGLFPT